MRFDGKISTSVHDIELRCMEIMQNNNTNSDKEVKEAIRKDKTN